MQTSQSKILQIALTIIGLIGLVYLYVLKFQDIQVPENQDSIVRFIGFGSIAWANYLNYRNLVKSGNNNSKWLLWLSIFLGVTALGALSKIFF